MGLFDKIKDVAKNVSETATEKISSIKEGKNKAELAKYAKHAPVQDLPIIGFVSSFAGLENIKGAELCLDGENELLYIRIKATKGPYEYSNVGDFKIDNFIEFRYVNNEVRKMSHITMFLDHFELVYLGSHSIGVHTTTTSFNTNSDRIPKLDDFNKKARMNLIYPFVNLITDEETISWVNNFCLRNDLLPLFDENGELIVENMKKNADLACNK